MDFIKSQFTITDLANLTGIKKHTIRIWEKRYQLLSPERTESNIRLYTPASLIKLLNIVLLYNHGYKISAIARMSNTAILTHCNKLVNAEAVQSRYINSLKIAMMHFDQAAFEDVFDKLSALHTFSEIFDNFFIPLLVEIGYLWQTGTVNPAHEHFITSLIKLKIAVQIDGLDLPLTNDIGKQFVLFLPDNEIHDIGLTYLHYEILKHGYLSIFLGQSVPIDSLLTFKGNNTVFISYFTTKPDAHQIQTYLDTFYRDILENSSAELWILGHLLRMDADLNLNDQIVPFYSVKEIFKKL